MSDTPEGREPEQRLPVPRPPAEPAPVERFIVAAGDPQRRADARAGGPGRPPVLERALGRLPAVVVVDPVHHDLLVLRARAARLPRAAARRRGQRPAGHLGRARLQPVRGELRALPRRQRRGRDRAGAQPPGQAVRPPVGRLPQQHDGRRRPLRLRQRQLDHAGLVQRGPSARAAQLHPDRGPDRVHPGPQQRDLHDPRSRARASRSSTRSPTRSRRSTAGSTSTTSRHPARRRSRPAGPTSSTAASGRRRPLAGSAPGGRRSTPNAPVKVDVTASGIAFTTPGRDGAGGQALRIEFDNQDAEHAAQHRDQGLDRRGQVHRRDLQRRRHPAPTRCRRSPPGPTRSCAPCTRR